MVRVEILKARCTKSTSKNWWWRRLTFAVPLITCDLWQNRSQNSCTEHTTANGQWAQTFCTCMKGNYSIPAGGSSLYLLLKRELEDRQDGCSNLSAEPWINTLKCLTWNNHAQSKTCKKKKNMLDMFVKVPACATCGKSCGAIFSSHTIFITSGCKHLPQDSINGVHTG